MGPVGSPAKSIVCYEAGGKEEKGYDHDQDYI